MQGLFPPRSFSGFGPNALEPSGGASPLVQVHASRPSGLKARVRLESPRKPGVYGMLNARAELIYVGKAKCLRSRLLSYFRPKSRDPKAGEILKEARCIVWELAANEFAALLRELELIRRWQPRFNVQGQPRRKRRWWVCLGRRPAPHVFIAPRPPATTLASFGPIPAGLEAREAVRRLNDWYRLRDCPHPQDMIFSDQQDLFPIVRAAGCLRHEIDQCLGPCAAACSRADYEVNVRAARAFLDGKDTSPLETLEREMTAASTALQFERAASLRDKLVVLHWLWDHLARLKEARALSFVYPVQGHNLQELWYVIHQGLVRKVLPAPVNRKEKATTVEILHRLYEDRIHPMNPLAQEAVDGLLLVAAWFRKHPEERNRTFQLEDVMQCLGAEGVEKIAASPTVNVSEGS